MRRYLVPVLAIAAVTSLVASTGVKAAVYPSVGFSFDPSTYTYTYTITQPANGSYAFGYLQIDTGVLNQAPTGPWEMHGPYVSSVDQAWLQGFHTTSATTASAYWRAVGNQEVPASTAWVGVFTLRVPNSVPVSGYSLTMDGVVNTQNITQVSVPGPGLVPEPSTLVALASTALAGLLALRRKS